MILPPTSQPCPAASILCALPAHHNFFTFLCGLRRRVLCSSVTIAPNQNYLLAAVAAGWMEKQTLSGEAFNEAKNEAKNDGTKCAWTLTQQ
jgi:hypothetical protein